MVFDLICPLTYWFQAGALVQVYTDGTVLVTHGGVEMGQGLHTKVAQIAASSFNIPLKSVFISETSTDKVIKLRCIYVSSCISFCLTSVILNGDLKKNAQTF